MLKTIEASKDHEAFYQEVCAAMQLSCKHYPSIKNLDIIACLGRMTGYCVAMCFPSERDVARTTAIVNLDQAVKDVDQDEPA